MPKEIISDEEISKTSENIYRICENCQETGKVRIYSDDGSYVESDCERCNGLGYEKWGVIRKEKL